MRAASCANNAFRNSSSIEEVNIRFSDINRNPDRRTLRQFALLGLLILGGMGIARLVPSRSSAAGWLFVAAALVMAFLGTAFPKMLKPVFVGWLTLAFPIGWLLSHAVLAALYFGAFTPLAILFRLRGRDMLTLKKSSGETYWTEKPQASDPGQYLSQF